MPAPRYLVLISEPVETDITVGPGEPTPEVRDVWWEGDADSAEAAREIAMNAAASLWREKHGEDMPENPLVSVQLGPDVCPTCQGRGWVPRPTRTPKTNAKRTATQSEPQGPPPGDARARRVWEGGKIECRLDRQVYHWPMSRAIASVRAERQAQWRDVAEEGCSAAYGP
jgi:hypothetical protein